MSKESKLHIALRQIVSTYGHEIYQNPKLINYLNDYCQFDPPALYFVMKTLIQDGYSGKLLETSKGDDWKLLVQQSIGKVQKQYGFSGIYVNYCFQSLAYGIGLYPAINQRLLDEVEGKIPDKPVQQPQPQTQSPPIQQPPPVTKPKTQPKRKTTVPNKQSTGTTWGIPTGGSVWGRSTSGSQSGWPGGTVQQPINIPGLSPTSSPTTNKGCSTGCLDDVSSIFSIIIFILWLLIECS